MEGDMICYTDGIRSQELLNVHDMNLIGAHNYENVMAAVCITKAAGIPDEIIVEQIKQFKAVEHRIEFVTEKNGVRYYNDSKGTNPEAAVKAIEAMTRPTVLIGGGYGSIELLPDMIKAQNLIYMSKHLKIVSSFWY